MNIGLLVPDLGTSQLAYMAINQVNLASTVDKDNSYYLFYENATMPCVNPLVACMNISELHTFKGVLISTSIDLTLASLNAVTNTRKLFYVWDLEWLRPNKNNFLYNMQAFRNEQVEILSRSNSHARAVENYCNRTPSLIVNNFNLLAIKEHLREEQ